MSAEETARGISFCGHAILDNKIFEVSDASKDERFLLFIKRASKDIVEILPVHKTSFFLVDNSWRDKYNELRSGLNWVISSLKQPPNNRKIF